MMKLKYTLLQINSLDGYLLSGFNANLTLVRHVPKWTTVHAHYNQLLMYSVW